MYAMQNRAHVLSEHLKRGPDAVKALDALVAVYPEVAKARGGRAVLHARLGDRAAAHRDAAACLRLDPSPGTLYQLAGVYALTSAGAPRTGGRRCGCSRPPSPAGSATSPPSTGTPTWTRFRTLPEFAALVKDARARAAAATSEKK
jgi:hypothetical protein